MATWKVCDTVTYYREWTVEADSEDEAIHKAECQEPDIEEQCDNTPFEAVQEEEAGDD